MNDTFAPQFMNRAHRADTGRPAPMVEPINQNGFNNTGGLPSDYAPSKKMLTELKDILEERLNQSPLCFIAEALIKLPYIDMVNFAEGVKADPRVIYDWAKGYPATQTKPEDAP